MLNEGEYIYPLRGMHLRLDRHWSKHQKYLFSIPFIPPFEHGVPESVTWWETPTIFASWLNISFFKFVGSSDISILATPMTAHQYITAVATYSADVSEVGKNHA